MPSKDKKKTTSSAELATEEQDAVDGIIGNDDDFRGIKHKTKDRKEKGEGKKKNKDKKDEDSEKKKDRNSKREKEKKTELELTEQKKEKKQSKNKEKKEEKKSKKRKLDQDGELEEEDKSIQVTVKTQRDGALELRKRDKQEKKKQVNDNADDFAHNGNGGPANGHNHANSKSFTPEQIQSANLYREKYVIEVDPSALANKYLPVMAFSETGLPQQVLEITKQFEHPTPVQAQSLPIALDGMDLISIARTGSGKTLAFGLPALHHVRKRKLEPSYLKTKASAPYVLVLSPTRELALQIASVLEDAGRSCQISSTCVYGGVDKAAQRKTLQQIMPDMIVATPGRLVDFMQDQVISMQKVSFVVLDEADRMLDLGFEKEVREVMKAIHENQVKVKQTLMFSATWPESVRKLAAQYLRDHKHCAKISIGGSGVTATASKQISQDVRVLTDPRDKDKFLEALLNGSEKNSKVIVFCLYKKEAARVEQRLSSKYQCISIHGDKNQRDRCKALEDFQNNNVRILIATDVAARGLDLPDVDCVINYTFPLTVEDYVHRIGRTGRGNKSGKSITFFTDHDKAHAGGLVNILKEANQPVPKEMMKYSLTTKKREHALYGAFARDDIQGTSTKITFD